MSNSPAWDNDNNKFSVSDKLNLLNPGVSKFNYIIGFSPSLCMNKT
jgi:hypothetical protein